MSSSEKMTTIIPFLDNAIKRIVDMALLSKIKKEMGPRWRAGSLGAGILLFIHRVL